MRSSRCLAACLQCSYRAKTQRFYLLTAVPALTTHVAFFPNALLILIPRTQRLTPRRKTQNQGLLTQWHSRGGTPSERTYLLRPSGRTERVRKKRTQAHPPASPSPPRLETSSILLHTDTAAAAAGPAHTSNFCSSSPHAVLAHHPSLRLFYTLSVKKKQPATRRALLKLAPAAVATTSADLLHFNCGC